MDDVDDGGRVIRATAMALAFGKAGDDCTRLMPNVFLLLLSKSILFSALCFWRFAALPCAFNPSQGQPRGPSTATVSRTVSPTVSPLFRRLFHYSRLEQMSK